MLLHHVMDMRANAHVFVFMSADLFRLVTFFVFNLLHSLLILPYFSSVSYPLLGIFFGKNDIAVEKS